jgi:TolB-like protein
VTGEVKKHKLAFLLLSVILLSATSAVSVWYFSNRQASTRQIESIAVLPFENASGNADLDYLSDGVSNYLN